MEVDMVVSRLYYGSSFHFCTSARTIEMITRRQLLATGAAAPFTPWSRAQTAVPREIRIVCGFPAGGTADTVARRAADGLAPAVARTALVETRTGAGGQLAVQAVKQSVPDGTTLLLTPLGLLSTLPHTYASLPYDPVNDFAAVGAGASFDYAIGVGPMVPASVKTVADLMQWCKANPGSASYGSPAAGTAPHFVGMLLGRKANVPMTHVPYRGTPPAIQDMVGGQIAIVIGPVGEFLQFAKDGKCRILATCGERRSRFSPEVATLQEQGHGDLLFTEWFAFFARSGTPMAAIERLNARIGEALSAPAVASNFAVLGMEVQLSTPAVLASRVQRDYAQWRDLVKAVSFTPLS
jgi:tripartite-type tricarboxylate transporter receptor subunit TctC